MKLFLFVSLAVAVIKVAKLPLQLIIEIVDVTRGGVCYDVI